MADKVPGQWGMPGVRAGVEGVRAGVKGQLHLTRVPEVWTGGVGGGDTAAPFTPPSHQDNPLSHPTLCPHPAGMRSTGSFSAATAAAAAPSAFQQQLAASSAAAAAVGAAAGGPVEVSGLQPGWEGSAPSRPLPLPLLRDGGQGGSGGGPVELCVMQGRAEWEARPAAGLTTRAITLA